jgi:threonine dehydrogenase-like Zn-dependent dehydrogenase
MKCRAAVLRGAGKDWEIQEITLDPPREGEVLVKTGICHTDDHFATGDSVPSPEMVEVLRASAIRDWRSRHELVAGARAVGRSTSSALIPLP